MENLSAIGTFLIILLASIGIGVLCRKYNLRRDTKNEVIAGVCAGIAKAVNVDRFWIRLAFLLSGMGLLFYIILCLAMEEE